LPIQSPLISIATVRDSLVTIAMVVCDPSLISFVV
jgi:hypothetical protein